MTLHRASASLDRCGGLICDTLPVVHLLALTPEQLVESAAGSGVAVRLDEARRLLVEAHSDPRAPRKVRPVAASTRRAVFELFAQDRVEVVERATDEADGFVKYLFRGAHGDLFEAVRIPLHAEGRFTVCLSSQVGCAMRCAFCATGRLGLRRNLHAWEMISAFSTVRNEALGRITGAVFQGQGEPLQNYDAVMRTAQVLSHPCCGRISGRAITISTVGLVPQIRRFTAEAWPYRLIVSVTSTQPQRRETLLPVASRSRWEELVTAIADHARARRESITLAWVLIGGVNDDAIEVEGLARAFAGVPVILNLIDVNDARPDGFSRASDERRHAFLEGLKAAGIPFRRRYSGGVQRHAGCGMLAARHCGESLVPLGRPALE